MSYITVSFCCNDERGNDTGKVSAIDFGDAHETVAPSIEAERRIASLRKVGE